MSLDDFRRENSEKGPKTPFRLRKKSGFPKSLVPVPGTYVGTCRLHDMYTYVGLDLHASETGRSRSLPAYT